MVGVDEGVRSKIYKRIIEQLQSDQILLNIFGRAWEVGFPQDEFYPPSAGETGIRIELGLGSQDQKTPASQGGALILTFAYWMPSYNDNLGPNVLDCLDVWEAIEAVFYPADRAKRNAFKLELQHLGAETGEVLISDPMSDMVKDKQDASWIMVSRVALNIKKNLNKG